MNAQASAAPAVAGVAEVGLLDQIVEQSKVAKSASEHARAKDIISELAREVLQGTVVISENLNLTLDARVAELDRMISEQLTAVMHAPEFQQLESTWRGLHYLCGQTSTGAQLKIKVLNASKKESIQKRLEKVRPPRVQLTYDVETGDAIEQKEIPFVVGVLGDFSGQPDQPLPRIKDRKFVNVDLDNFDEVMEGMAPRAAYRAQNTLTGDGEIAVEMTFKSIDDFRPEAVVQQVEPLRKLLEARTKLADLRNKVAGNEKLEDLLNDVLANTEQLKQLGRKDPVDQE